MAERTRIIGLRRQRASSTELEEIPTKIKISHLEVHTSEISPGCSYNLERADGETYNEAKNQQRRRLQISDSHFYFISVWHNSNYSRAKVMNILQNHAQLSFEVLQCFRKDNKTTFVSDDYNLANVLNNTCIFRMDGTKVFTLAESYKPITTYQPFDLSEILESTLLQRYDHMRKSLNLQKFYKDKSLLHYNIFCPLNIPSMVKLIIPIIRNYYKRAIRVLDLSENYLSNLDHIGPLIKLFPNLIHLRLRKNRISDIDQLSVLKQFDLQILCLEENEVCWKLNPENYTRSIQNLLPRLKVLDNVNLKVNQLELKRFQQKEMYSEFIKQYYKAYDSRNIDELKPMYATSAEILISGVIKEERSQEVEESLEYNLSRIHLEGNSNILEQLKVLPKTRHDFSSLSIDFCYLYMKSAKVKVSGYLSDEKTVTHDRIQFERVFTMEKNDKNVIYINKDEFTILRPTEIKQVLERNRMEFR